jgi:hypothetical protein
MQIQAWSSSPSSSSNPGAPNLTLYPFLELEVGSMLPSLNFPQLDFVRPSSGFHPVTWERVRDNVINVIHQQWLPFSSSWKAMKKIHVQNVPIITFQETHNLILFFLNGFSFIYGLPKNHIFFTLQKSIITFLHKFFLKGFHFLMWCNFVDYILSPFEPFKNKMPYQKVHM